MRVCSLCHEPVPAGMPVCPRDGASVTDSTPKDPLIGQMLGEYRLKGIVGEGGMGQVYEGVQPVIGKRVAIKLLRRELAADPIEAQRLLLEARTVNGIGHRGIIDIFSFGATADGRQYFVMEYLSGRSLSQHIAEHGALPLEDTLKLLDEVLAALGAAHAAGVIHRDLKPSNIFIVAQPDGTAFVKLLDFGIAKQAPSSRGETPQTRVSRIMGTPEFMAPEQARGHAVGPRTDLYALGVVAFEMLTGQRLFRADNPYELVNQHLNAKPRAPSAVVNGVPPEVDEVVLSLLEKDPADRPASAEAVREQLKRVRKSLALNATQLHVMPTAMSQADVAPVEETREAPVSGVVTDPGATLMDVPEADLEASRSRRAESRRPGVDSGVSDVSTRALRPVRSRTPWVVGVVALVMLTVAAAVALTWKPDQVLAPPEPARPSTPLGVTGVVPEPEPVAVTPEAEPVAEPPAPEPVVATIKRPAVVKQDALQSRYRRARGAWDKTRASRSAEDRRIFDMMIDQVGKQLASGARADATEALDDFVRGALGGREP